MYCCPDCRIFHNIMISIIIYKIQFHQKIIYLKDTVTAVTLAGCLFRISYDSFYSSSCGVLLSYFLYCAYKHLYCFPPQNPKYTYHFLSYKHFVRCFLHCTQLPVNILWCAWCGFPNFPHLLSYVTLLFSLSLSVFLPLTLSALSVFFWVSRPQILTLQCTLEEKTQLSLRGRVLVRHHQCLCTKQSKVLHYLSPNHSGCSASATLLRRQLFLLFVFWAYSQWFQANKQEI